MSDNQPQTDEPIAWYQKEFSWRATLLTGLSVGTFGSLLVGIPWLLRLESFHRTLEGLTELLPAISAVVLLGIVLLWVFVFKLKWRGRLIGIAVLVVAISSASAVLRLDGYYGSFFPHFVWRWTPTPEETLQEYFKTTGRRQKDEAGRQAAGLRSARLVSTENDFPGFRGADRLGVVRGIQLDRDWSAHPPRELWKHPIGLGWSGFSVVGELAFTQEQRGSDEIVVCYDLLTGKENWIVADPVEFHPSHGDGPRATPAVDRGKVYTVGATGILNCIDGATGERLWRKALLSDPDSQNQNWGLCGSPLIVNDLLIVCPGLPDGESLIALNPETGDVIWSTGDDPAAYSSPQLSSICEKPQILVFNGAGLVANDPATGHLLWSHPWITHGENTMNAAQPMVLADYDDLLPPNQVLISSGYTKGCVLLEVNASGGTFSVEEKWKNANLKAKYSNMIIANGHLFGLDNGILVCLDLVTGKRVWKRGRYGHGQLLLVGDLILIQAETGDVVLIEASSEKLHELGRFPALSSKTWNHLALAGKVLVVRNDREAAAFELPVQEQ
jgi:outer membrane protein assembly factor BamB